jgi:folate-binding protein YgfZ
VSAVFVEEGPDKGAIWHFGQPYKEQKELLSGNGWADLSHRAVISISGKDRLTWLHALTTQHLEQLPPGVWKEALILDAQGHIVEQLFLFDDGATTWIHTEAQRVAPLIDNLEKMKFMLEVEVEDQSIDYAVLRVAGISDDIGGPYEIVPKSKFAEIIADFNKSHTQVGMWATEALRVEQGRARLLFEVDHKSIPNELGFLNKAVHMKKGCYRGQETVAKVFNLGQPPRKLVLLHLDGSMVELPEHGAKITHDAKEIGFIGTVIRHFELGPIALGVIKRNTPQDANLLIGNISASINKDFTAR